LSTVVVLFGIGRDDVVLIVVECERPGNEDGLDQVGLNPCNS